jgi:glycerophosphoryl diester phosphodiesterase
MITKEIDVQGHRGCRGIFPENTIPGFLHALDLGVHTLEMDVVTSKDDQVIVSHDPYFHHDITLDPAGNEIRSNEQLAHNIYEMTLEEIQRYDVGSKSHPGFPQQKKFKATKPTLDQVLEAVERYLNDQNLPPVQYSIEIKRKPERDGKLHAEVNKFVDLVYEVIERFGLVDRCLIQSFDIETLQILHDRYPEMRLVYLIENQDPFEDNMKALGFTPEVYSPDFTLLDDELVRKVHESDMQLVPWTVNDTEDIEKCLAMDIDGIITDYPDRVFEFLRKH